MDKIEQEKSCKVLILGGSNFMGKALTKWFNDEAHNYQVFMINRGKTYWNNQIKKDHPKLHRYYGDRKEHKDFSKTINYINEKVEISENNRWKAVIDFTSYRWRDLQSSIKALKNKTQLYVFISSDSLYNNTHYDGQSIKQQKYNTQQAYAKLKGKKKKSDKYGYDKLKCELYLSRTRYVPYICLRLPDVIGPYDNTERYWASLFWLQKNKQYKLQFNEKDELMPLSFVYSEDVAKFIGNLAVKSQSIKKNESYNLGFNETPTFEQFMKTLAKSANHKQPLNVKYLKTLQDSSGFYPSTEYTCINCQKAKQELSWNPTKIEQAMKKTSSFFMQKGMNYEYERKQMMKEFKRKVVNSD